MNYLEDLLRRSSYDFYFLIVDKFLSISLPQLKNFHPLYKKNLKTKNSGYLLSLPEIKSQISQSQHPVIVPFKPSAKIELLCQKNQWINASNPAKSNRLLEDKVKFFNLAKKNNLPVIPGFIDEFNQNSFKQAQDLFTDKIVIQSHFGWAGNSTNLFSDYTTASKQIPQGTLVKFSPFIKGYSLLNNCCLTRYGLLQSPPALQYTGLKELTSNPFATVGRQWPSLASPNIQQKIWQITTDFSQKILAPLGYKGFFGLDFIVSDDEVYLLECNPRLTASFAFYTQMELQQQLNPLFYFHLAEFVNLDYEINLSKEQERFYNKNLVGSEITLRNSTGTTIKKINDFQAFSSEIEPLNISPQIIAELKS